MQFILKFIRSIQKIHRAIQKFTEQAAETGLGPSLAMAKPSMGSSPAQARARPKPGQSLIRPAAQAQA